LSTFVNGSYSTSGGWENVIKVEPMSEAAIATLSGTVRYTNVALATAADGVACATRALNWDAKLLLATYRFGSKANWNVQVNGEYESAIGSSRRGVTLAAVRSGPASAVQ
jgi:hypothetical protein